MLMPSVAKASRCASGMSAFAEASAIAEAMADRSARQFLRSENWWQGPESNRLLGFARKSFHIEG
jgi:hypothetical protein